MQLKDDNLAKNHPSPQNPPPDDVSIRKDLGNSWKNCVKVPAVHLALFQAVATGSKSACKQPVGSFSACCRGKSCPARGSAEACRALQQQLLQDLRSEPVRELFHTANLSAFYFYSLFCFFFFLHVETVLILLHCKHMSNFCLLRWSHTVYSYSFKENKFSQPEGLHLEGPVWIQKPSHVGCLLLGFLLSIISVNFFHASFSCLHQTVTLGQVYARFSSQLPAFGRSEWILRLRSLLFKQKRIFSNSVAVHQIY